MSYYYCLLHKRGHFGNVIFAIRLLTRYNGTQDNLYCLVFVNEGVRREYSAKQKRCFEWKSLIHFHLISG